MDAMTASAASGMRARLESLDLIANNLANAPAPGYKADREFYNTYLSADSGPGPDGAGSTMPVIERQWTDFSQGALTVTGNPLDMALKGGGFFVAISPSGPLLTRDGSFQLSSSGTLETQSGLPVRGRDGKPIQLDPSQQVEVTSSGDVLQAGQTVAQIDIVEAKDRRALGKHGLNFYEYTNGSVAPASSTGVRQGALESGNVQTAESAVRLVSVMRQFEMLQRAASIGSDMGKRALEEVAKVTG